MEHDENNSYLQRLIKTRNTLCKERDVAVSKRDAITSVAKGEGRDILNDDEDREFRVFLADVKRLDGEIKAKDELITELDDENQRRQDLRAGAAIADRASAKLESVREQITYVKNGPHSYFKDIAYRAMGLDTSNECSERIQRHAVDVSTDRAYRELETRTGINTTLGTGGAAVPPVYLLDQYITLARAGRPFADAVPSEQLLQTMQVNIPKITVGTAVLVQTTENSAVQETDITDTNVVANVSTAAGQQILSRQLLDQSPVAIDQIIFRDLTAAMAAYLDKQLWTGSGSSNQVTGVHNTSGITTIALTGLGIDNVYAAIANGIQSVHTNRFLPPDSIWMHPRRWGWFTSLLDPNGRPLVLPRDQGVFQAAGVLEKVDSQQVVGSIQGLPVITDPNIPTNLGAGTNQDPVYVMRSADHLLFESGVRAEAFPQTYANQMSVLLQVSEYFAFTAARYGASTVEITGFTPPTWAGS